MLRFVAPVAVQCLHERVPQGYGVALVRDEAQLRALWDVNRALYGNGALEFDAYARWWQRYPKAVHVLLHGDAVVGGITAWPLRHSAFARVMRGTWSLALEDFHTLQDVKHCRYWYVSGIVIRPEHRSAAVLRALMKRALRDGIEAAQAPLGANICAVAFSQQGARLLERFGFARRPSTTPEGYPVYALLGIGPALLWTMTLRALGYKRRAAAGSRFPMNSATRPAAGGSRFESTTIT